MTRLDFITNASIVDVAVSRIATNLCAYTNVPDGIDFLPYCLPDVRTITTAPVYIDHYLVNSSVPDTITSNVTVGEWQTFHVLLTLQEGTGLLTVTYH